MRDMLMRKGFTAESALIIVEGEHRRAESSERRSCVAPLDILTMVL